MELRGEVRTRYIEPSVFLRVDGDPLWRKCKEKTIKLRPSQEVKYARLATFSIEYPGEGT